MATTKRKAKREKFALYQRGESKIWYISTLRESTHTTDYAIAQQRRDFIVQERDAGRWQQRKIADKFTFAQLAGRYMSDRVFDAVNTETYYRTRIAQLSKFFGRYSLADIDAASIYQYQDYRRSEEKRPANSTVAGEITVLSALIKYAIRLNWLGVNITREVLKPRCPKDGHGKPLSEREEQQLIDYCVNAELMSGNLADIIVMGIYTGQRRGSIISRCWEHVDFADNSITCRNSKKKRDYRVPLAYPVREMLLRRYKDGATGLIFSTSNGTMYDGHDFWRDFKRACKLSGIGDKTVHDMRHTCGSRLAEAGYTAGQISTILDHTSEEVTKLYCKHSMNSKRKIMEHFGRKPAEITA